MKLRVCVKSVLSRVCGCVCVCRARGSVRVSGPVVPFGRAQAPRTQGVLEAMGEWFVSRGSLHRRLIFFCVERAPAEWAFYRSRGKALYGVADDSHRSRPRGFCLFLVPGHVTYKNRPPVMPPFVLAHGVDEHAAQCISKRPYDRRQAKCK